MSQTTCDIFYVNEKKVRAVAAYLDQVNHLFEQAELFKVLSDPMRLKIVMALDREELCVCDLASLLGVTRPAVSHHLRILRHLRLVKYRREGKIVFYALMDGPVRELLKAARKAIQPVQET